MLANDTGNLQVTFSHTHYTFNRTYADYTHTVYMQRESDLQIYYSITPRYLLSASKSTASLPLHL